VPRAARPSRLGELAAHLGREVRIDGAGDPLIEGVASLERAGPGDLAHCRTARHVDSARKSGAAAFVAPPGLDVDERPLLRSARPDLDFARLVRALMDAGEARPFPDRSVEIAPDALIDGRASIGPGCVVGARSKLGPGTALHAGVVVYPDVEIGADCTIHAGVVLREGTRVGDRVVLHPGVVLGADGFGYTGDEEGRLFKIPQVGIVVIEDDVEIGAGTTVDRATLDETRIRRGARIDNLVQIAHNCDVGEGAVIAAQVGLAGSVRVGAGAALMGQVGVADHVEIGAGAFAAARSGIMRDVPPGARVFGQPAVPEKGWHRVTAALPRLPDALRRLRRLERQLEAGEAPGSKPARPSTDEDA